MPYDIIKEIVSNLKKTSPCPFCKAKLNDSSILMLAGAENPENDAFYGLFLVACPKCEAEAMVGIEASCGPNGHHIHHYTQQEMGEKISMNEVLDVHNRLKKWSGGDVKELFR